jgi:hypothetical protein
MINDIGDYKLLGKFDKIISKCIKIFGRYIVLLGEKQ